MQYMQYISIYIYIYICNIPQGHDQGPQRVALLPHAALNTAGAFMCVVALLAKIGVGGKVVLEAVS